MRKKRRWWLVALIVVIVVAAAVAGALLLLDRNKSTPVHYLTSTAAKGTIAQTVQADFTLAGAHDSMTISLSGTGSSANSTSSSAATTATGATTVSMATHGALATGAMTLDRTIVTGDTATPTPTPAPTPTLTSFTPTSGAVGSTVTLAGSGLAGTTAVGFNGRAAFFRVVSDTQVTTIVPAGASSGPIAVTSSGATAVSAARFTVSRKPGATPRPTPSRTGSSTTGSGSGGSSSFAGRSSATATSSGTGSTTSSGSSASTSTRGVVTGIALTAGTTPRMLERLLTISGKPIYAFVSASPLFETLSTSLSAGSQRSSVAALQHALKADGYFTGTINGDFGTTTKTAIEDWQAARGLARTGQITTTQFVWVPKGATVESWNVSLGGSVSSATALATVGYPRDLIAQAQVTQADVPSLKVGQKAALTIDGETSGPFTATITAIAGQPASSSSAGGSSTTVEYTVDLSPHALPALARSGMTGALTVTIASRSNVLVVPTSAVSGSSSSTFVRVMLNGTPTYRQVSTGMATSSLTQITSGLVAGEVVVTGQYTDSATNSTSSGGLGGLGGLGGFGGGSGFRRSAGGSTTGGSGPGIGGP